MIEEQGVVVKLVGDVALVETARKSSCGSCEAKGCGTGALAQVMAPKKHTIQVNNSLDAEVGDEVVLGVTEAALIKGSLALYLVPLLTMMAGAMFAEFVSPQWQINNTEMFSSLLGIGGFVIGLLWVRHFGRRAANDPKYQAVMLRRTPGVRFANIPVNHQ